MFGKDCLAFGTTSQQLLENLRKSPESVRKSSENRQKMDVYILNRIILGGLLKSNFSSRVQLVISLVRCTRRGIPFLRAPMYYPPFLSGVLKATVRQTMLGEIYYVFTQIATYFSSYFIQRILS